MVLSLLQLLQLVELKLVSFVSEGEAMDYLVKNTFNEGAGARKSYPKIAVIITDGKSQDPVTESAEALRSSGVEVFVLGRLFSSILSYLTKNAHAYHSPYIA